MSFTKSAAFTQPSRNDIIKFSLDSDWLLPVYVVNNLRSSLWVRFKGFEMEMELVELFEAAKKAADAAAVDGVSSGGPEVSRCVDVLKELKTFPVSYDTLVNTQVGKRLRPLTKHPREKIRTVASNLLEIWKKIVIEETTKNKKNGGVDNKSSVKTEAVKHDPVKVEKAQKTSAVKVEKISTAETVKVEKTGNVSRSETVKVDKREANGNSVTAEKSGVGEPVRFEKIIKDEQHGSIVKKPSPAPIATPKFTSLIKCNDALRDKIRELLVEALSKVAGESDEETIHEVNACDPIRVAVAVESVMFEKLGRSSGAQKLKYRSIMFNIKDPKNPDFRRRVLLGEIKPERIVTMTAEEMASDARQQETEQIKEKALNNCERGQQSKATTDQFKCGRCHKRECTYYQMQTRSADEPMTTYVTCVSCNLRWKFC